MTTRRSGVSTRRARTCASSAPKSCAARASDTSCFSHGTSSARSCGAAGPSDTAAGSSGPCRRSRSSRDRIGDPRRRAARARATHRRAGHAARSLARIAPAGHGAPGPRDYVARRCTARDALPPAPDRSLLRARGARVHGARRPARRAVYERGVPSLCRREPSHPTGRGPRLRRGGRCDGVLPPDRRGRRLRRVRLPLRRCGGRHRLAGRCADPLAARPRRRDVRGGAPGGPRAGRGGGALVKILVTGNLGYIGPVLTQAFLANGHQVHGYDSALFERFATGPLPRLASQTVADLRDRHALRRAIGECEAVVHLAAMFHEPLRALDPTVTRAVNLHATLDLIEASRGRALVVNSSASIYGVSDAACGEGGVAQPLTAFSALK